MQEHILKELLKEYEQYRISAELDLDKRKDSLYKKYPQLEEIDKTINSYAIQKAKQILLSNSSVSIIELENKLNDLKNQKKKLISDLNISEESLSPHYRCTICKDTGFFKNSMCSCLKQRLLDLAYNKSNIGNLDKENFDNFNELLYSDEINTEKYNSNLSPRENIKIIKKKSLEFVKNFKSPEEKNLLFTGNPGLGKTFISNCIAREVINNGNTVLYQTAPVMLDNIIDYRYGRNNISDSFYKNLLETDLLIIDDLGTETINSMKFTELFNVLNARLLNSSNKITKTIISTNLSLQNILSTYDERIFSRIVGYYNLYRFYGDDIRIKKK